MVSFSLDTVKEKLSDKTTLLTIGGVAAGLTGLYLAKRAWDNSVPKAGPYPPGSLPEGAYDAVIVGGGPSGSTMGYYCSKAGLKVAVLDKETFPRDKYCGDAVCTPAIKILTDMGVMQELIDNDEAKFADSGGFVSPSGISFIGASAETLGQAACAAVKRIHLDTRIAHAGKRAGSDLKEKFEVTEATFDAEKGLWTVCSKDGKSVQGRVLVCADGAQSKLATKLGYCTAPPKGVCSRAYVKGGTHNTDFDGVCFYQRESLPGYSAIFRHPKDELNYCYYLIPHGEGKDDADGQCGDVKESDLARLHNEAIKNDPFISKALGPNAEIERMKAGSLRLGCQGITTTFDDHLLLIGDAAGHIDPLTGEGIHTAIQGGKAAAETMVLMHATGDYSKKSTKQYYRKWMHLFGHDFGMSTAAADFLYKNPIVLDATASEMQRQGNAMMSKWAEVMTGMQPKTYFLRPDIALNMGVAIVREFVEQKFFGKPDLYANPHLIQ